MGLHRSWQGKWLTSLTLREMLQVSFASVKSVVSLEILHLLHLSGANTSGLGGTKTTVQTGSYLSGKKLEIIWIERTEENFQGRKLWSPEGCQYIPYLSANAIGPNADDYLKYIIGKHRFLDDPWNKPKTSEYKWRADWLSQGYMCADLKKSVLVLK